MSVHQHAAGWERKSGGPPRRAPPDVKRLDDEYAMAFAKVIPCSRSYPHDWTCCPFAHHTEAARRRDPRVHPHTGIACPRMKQEGRCELGDSCPYAHSIFEYWLHPTRYRTQLCKDGPDCRRYLCFFAHNLEELRTPRDAELRLPVAAAGTAAAAQAAAAAQRSGGPRSGAALQPHAQPMRRQWLVGAGASVASSSSSASLHAQQQQQQQQPSRPASGPQQLAAAAPPQRPSLEILAMPAGQPPQAQEQQQLHRPLPPQDAAPPQQQWQQQQQQQRALQQQQQQRALQQQQQLQPRPLPDAALQEGAPAQGGQADLAGMVLRLLEAGHIVAEEAAAVLQQLRLPAPPHQLQRELLPNSQPPFPWGGAQPYSHPGLFPTSGRLGLGLDQQLLPAAVSDTPRWTPPQALAPPGAAAAAGSSSYGWSLGPAAAHSLPLARLLAHCELPPGAAAHLHQQWPSPSAQEVLSMQQQQQQQVRSAAASVLRAAHGRAGGAALLAASAEPASLAPAPPPFLLHSRGSPPVLHSRS